MPRKPFTDYLETKPSWWERSLDEYSRSPVSAFLAEVVHLTDSVNHCIRHFPKRKDHSYTKDSQDSTYRICASTHAAIMGHFELMQRLLFAGLFEATRLIPEFDVVNFTRQLTKDSNVSIELVPLTAYRGRKAQIGQVIADNLYGWHEPSNVNRHFQALVPKVTLYSNDETAELLLLWQLRHSIVHTAGWLTTPDSQKLRELVPFGDRPIIIGGSFILAVARGFHRIVSRAVGRLAGSFGEMLPADLTDVERHEVDNLLLVASPRKSWFPR